MTLLEMLLALTVFSVVMAGSLAFLRGQSRAFTLGSRRAATVENLRFALNLLVEDLRTVGAGVPDVQPSLVYAGRDVVAFNADYTTNVKDDAFAVYYDPDAPTGSVTALTQSQRLQIPNTIFSYPDTTYPPGADVDSPAETIVFFFTPDTATADPNDYALYRQVNRQPPELVARNLLAVPGTPFFEYFRLVTPATGAQQVVPVAAASLPLAHVVPLHLSPADTGRAALVDSVRAIRINITGTNGMSGSDLRQHSLSRLVWLPNAGMAVKRTCGDAPLFNAAVLATRDAGPSGDPVVKLTWDAATDETGGERDVVRYVVWRRLAADPDWGDPYLSIPAGNATYAYTDAGLTSGETYVYAVAAQDCTPSLSPLSASNTVTIP